MCRFVLALVSLRSSFALSSPSLLLAFDLASTSLLRRFALASTALRPGFDLDPPSGELVDRMQRVEAAFEAILSHVNDVNAHVARDYVLLRREACGAANALFRAPASEEEEQDKLRTVFTRSPILRQSSQRGLSFRPYPSCELLCRSHILSNSMDLQTLAAPP